MVTLIFTLTMPGKASWNGRWSGEGRLYARTRKVSEKTAAKAVGNYGHRWDDGWWASIEVTRSSGAAETRKVTTKSAGFSGYDWMIDNILHYGQTEKPEKLVVPEFEWVPVAGVKLKVGDLVKLGPDAQAEDVVVGFGEEGSNTVQVTGGWTWALTNMYVVRAKA